VSVAGLPAGAVLRVDGALVDPGSFSAVGGAHKLEASRPGFRALSKVVDLAADTNVTLAMAPALPPSLESAVASAAATGAALPPALSALLQKDGDEAIVVLAGEATAIKGVIWTRGKAPIALAPAKKGAPRRWPSRRQTRSRRRPPRRRRRRPHRW